jgi:hypothetical protein
MGGTVLGQSGDWPDGLKSASSRLFLTGTARKTKAMRALRRMAFAGTVPLLAKIPSPLT